MKIEKFNANNLDTLRDVLEAALDAAGKQFNISLKLGVMRYERKGQFFTCKLDGAVLAESGDAITKEARDYYTYAPPLGIPETTLFQTFSHDGREFKIIGWKARATKRPVVCSTADGRVFSFSVSLVKRMLAI